MDLALHLHPAAAATAALAGGVLEAVFRRAGCYPRLRARAWVPGVFSVVVVALILAEALARLGIGSFAGGALGGLALGALYAAPRLTEGGWPAPDGLLPAACRLAQFALMGAAIGGLH